MFFDKLKDASTSDYVVWIGYDPLEDSCAKMLANSIRKRTNLKNLKIIPIIRDQLLAYDIFRRPIDPNGSTQFSLTRFMVPYLMNYSGTGIFLDCDMLITRDIKEFFDMSDESYAVQCVKHDYIPKSNAKMGGKPQSIYPRKNWSSSVIYNCNHPSIKKLSREIVERKSPKFLHRFEWINDNEIGELPIEFNFLVGEYAMTEKLPYNIHHTLGPPIYKECVNCDYSVFWKSEFKDTFKREFDENIDCI